MSFDEMINVCMTCEKETCEEETCEKRKNMLCTRACFYDENDEGCKNVMSKELNYKSDNLSDEVYERRMKALHDGASIEDIRAGKYDEVNNTINFKVNEKDMQETLKQMGETFKIKNKKYGNSFESSLDKYGMVAALTRINDKFNRAENLILNNDNGTDDETLTDTLLDMANYCIMTAIYNKNLKGEK